MDFTSFLTIAIVFIIFGYLILARMRQKDPKKYDAMVGWIKKPRKPSNESKPISANEIKQIVLPDNARIM